MSFMLQNMMDEESKEYSRFDMDVQHRRSWRDCVHGKRGLILVVSAALVIFIQFVMVFVMFGYQERKFVELERIMSHSSSPNTMNSELRDSESQKRTLIALNKLSSSIMSLSSKLQRTDQRVMSVLREIRVKLGSSSKAAGRSSCRAGWTEFGSRCYFFSDDELNWHQARDYCRSQDAFLFTVDDEDEWEFVHPWTQSKFYWVGLTDEVTGQWRWDDGTPYVMNTDEWEAGQPDDWKEHGLGEEEEEGEEGEDCAYIEKAGKLNDAHCSIENHYICKAAAPTTTIASIVTTH